LILVDTNVWSELTKPRGNPAVLAWLEAYDEDLALSTLVIAEIRYGIELVGSPDKRASLAAWLDGMESRYYSQTWRFDREDAHCYGRIAALPEVKARKPQVIDIQLAAQALARGASLATRNVKDFDWTGVKLVDPWKA
jgi:predicted nucleic acid-binding protein